MRYWLLRAATWLAARVPRGARISIAGAATTLVFYLWRSKQRATVANMAQIIGAGEHDPYAFRLARDSWRDHGRYISDFLAFSARPERTREYVLAHWRDEQPAPGSLALLDAARAEGKGVLIVTCHFGAWDIAGLITATRGELHVVAERFDDPRIDAMVEAQRNAMGMQVLWLEKSPRQILRVLQQGGMVAILVDRPMHEGEGVPVEFFGRRCYVPGGVAQLALLSGAAIFPGFAYYDKRFSSTYYTRVLPHFFAARTGDRAADAVTTTQRIYNALETVIRPRPAQWAMFRPFWPAEPVASRAPVTQATAQTAGRSQA
jgi:KDO2-lipid IV(A) lauroyltransferase